METYQRKTFKDLNEGDIVWFVQGTQIKNLTVKSIYIKEFPALSDTKTKETKCDIEPYYNIELCEEWGYSYRLFYKVGTYKHKTDTVPPHGNSYPFCCYLNKKDAIIKLKKNIQIAIKAKQEAIKSFTKDIEALKKINGSL